MTENEKEFIRALKFLLISISAGVIQFGVTTLMNEVLGIVYWVSYGVGLVLSVLWNFTINRRYTFKSANNVPIAMLKVALFYVVFTPLSTWGSSALENLGWEGMLVTALTMVVNFVLEFLYCRFFVFVKSLDTNDIAKKEQQKQ